MPPAPDHLRRITGVMTRIMIRPISELMSAAPVLLQGATNGLNKPHQPDILVIQRPESSASAVSGYSQYSPPGDGHTNYGRGDPRTGLPAVPFPERPLTAKQEYYAVKWAPLARGTELRHMTPHGQADRPWK